MAFDNADEKELLLGYGWRHTRLAWSASKIKQSPVGYSDARNSYLGDSFSVFSFVLLAVACRRRFLPRLRYRHLAARMGMAPGFRAVLRATCPLARALCYGSTAREINYLAPTVDMFNR